MRVPARRRAASVHATQNSVFTDVKIRNFQRKAAEHSVRGLTGVKGVSNKLTLKSRQVQADVVKQKIEEALKREAVHEAKQITVDIHGSTVTLSGKVNSFAEMSDAKLAAWSAPGVTKIENKLHIGY